MSNRKDDHIEQALKQPMKPNDFDRVRFVPEALAQLDTKRIDASVDVFDWRFEHPIYINAMSGGSDRAKEMNIKLAKLAAHFNLPMASGSVSAAIKDSQWNESFRVIRDHHPKGFILANVGLSQTLDGALKAVDLLKANALQIHLNSAQEIVMPEGDRDFSFWEERLKSMLEAVPVPIVVKEVGFGMAKPSLDHFASLGVKYVDVSGRGGTNFITIENARRKYPLTHFDDFGFSTVESLLEAKSSPLTVFASGGVRGAFDVVKALALGAKMVGLSGYFLKLVQHHTLDEAIAITDQFLKDIRLIMAILNAPNLTALREKTLVFEGSLQQFINQRQS